MERKSLCAYQIPFRNDDVFYYFGKYIKAVNPIQFQNCLKMKNKYVFVLNVILFSLFSLSVSAQDINDIGRQKVNQLKSEGKLTGKEHYTNRNAKPIQVNTTTSSGNNSAQSLSSCNCWIPRDASFQIGQFDASGGSGGPGLAPEFRNDDWSTDTITLPFNICFYGTSVNKIFLNNNGNISIGAPYSTFTANSFPDPTYVMIAPFWADVDTRGFQSGLVYYSLTATHLIVQWENVGYYGTHDDKLNTFQLIVTNGADPIIPNGQNVSFCYKDMQWTTGDASQGINGFGGVPATVGVNRGNGVDYLQFGLFDQAGSNFDGAYGAHDGVDWLDNQSFTLNACILNANIPPVLNSLNICDTIRLCQNTTYQLTANYLSPEQAQTTNVNFSSGGMTGVTVLSNTPGNAAKLVLEIVGQTSNLGFHTISVTATDNGTPAATTINNFVVEVLPALVPEFTFSPNNFILVNTPINFLNTALPGSVLIWDFGDGSPTTNSRNPQHAYTNGGTYTVTLTATFPNGCETQVSHQVVIIQCAPATFTVSKACVNQPATITYTGYSSPNAQYIWNFNNGNVLSGSGMGPYNVSWNGAGISSVELTVLEGTCSSTVSMPVNIFEIPISSITPLPNLCSGESHNINFDGMAGSGASYTWNFGNATLLSGSGSGPYNIRWNGSGNDRVSLIVSENGCSDTSQINVEINPIPTSNFIVASTTCANEPVNVSYTGSASPSANYTWNFDGGIVSSGSGQGPYTVSWKNVRNYLLSLTVAENGCTSPQASMPLRVTGVPVASISPVSNICIGQTSNVSFTGNTGNGSIFNWYFGNATVISGSGQGPYTLQWNSAGNNHVQVEVNDNGCISQSFIDVKVFDKPTSDFIIGNTVCANTPVLMNYTGTASSSANYNWLFNGGTIVSGSGAGPYSVVWNSTGVISVSLSVNENGCLSTPTVLSAVINPLPVVFAGNDQTVCSGTPVSIGSTSVAGETYEWTPSANLSNSSISNPTATTINNTSESIQNLFILSTTNSIGCKNTDTVSVSTYPTPVINFQKPAAQCLRGNSFLISALANIQTGMNYSWSFSPEANIASSNQSVVSLTYSTVGIFPILLTGDYNGCPASSYIDSVSVYEMPISNFYPVITSGCEPLTVPFKNISIGNTNSYYWNFGDGGVDASSNAVHVFQHAGEYTVSLTAVNKNGCSVDTSYHSIISVYSKPVGQFATNPDFTDIVLPVFQFQNYSSNAVSSIWNFGDSDSSNVWSPSHTYSDTGSYLITLKLTSANGCTDTVKGLVRVEDSFSFYVPNSFTPNGDGVNDSFKGYGVSIKNYLMNIYNRWGELIYTTDNYERPWDGRLKSEVVQNDVFVYRIVLTDQHDHKHTYLGNVSVIK